MTKEIREVDKERGIVQITSVDERWYAREAKHPITGLPVYDYVPSVTWVADHYPKSIGFYKWLANHGWDEAQAIRNAAGDKGSKVHYAIKALLAGETVAMESAFFNETIGKPEQLSLEEYECLMSFVAWFAEAKPTVIDSEYVVWNEEHHYAGMVDLLCILSDEYVRREKLSGEGTWCIDLKTSQDIWPPMELQVSAYRKADIRIEHTAILQLGYRRNRKRFKFTEIPDKFDLFLAAQQIWANETAGDKPLQRDYPLVLSLPGVEPHKRLEEVTV